MRGKATLLRSTNLSAVLVSLAAAIAMTLMTGSPLVAQGTPGSPLALEKVEALVRLQTPDSVVAGEIRGRGLDFAPSKETLAGLRRLGAGPATLEAVDRLRPLLAEAKEAIPSILNSVYSALDAGNLGAVRPLLSTELAADAGKLDSICKPFTYRAHRIDRIIEKPDRMVDAFVRVLFQPLTEHAYRLTFVSFQGQFVLAGVEGSSRNTLELFAPQMQRAEELVRKFVYAARAGKREVLPQLLSPSLDVDSLFRGKMAKAWAFDKVDERFVKVTVEQYKGLKAAVYVSTGGTCCTPSGTFLVESLDGEARIVKWSWRHPAIPLPGGAEGTAQAEAEDPNLEANTLKRFGLSAPEVPRRGETPKPIGELVVGAGGAPLGRNPLPAVPASSDGSVESASLDPKVWRDLGWTRFAADDVTALSAWQKVLALGGSLEFAAAQYTSNWQGRLNSASKGTLLIDPQVVAFKTDKGESVFSIPVAQLNDPAFHAYGFREPLDQYFGLEMKTDGKRRILSLAPPGSDCAAYAVDDIVYAYGCSGPAVARQGSLTVLLSRLLKKK